MYWDKHCTLYAVSVPFLFFIQQVILNNDVLTIFSLLLSGSVSVLCCILLGDEAFDKNYNNQSFFI